MGSGVPFGDLWLFPPCLPSSGKIGIAYGSKEGPREAVDLGVAGSAASIVVVHASAAKLFVLLEGSAQDGGGVWVVELHLQQRKFAVVNRSHLPTLHLVVHALYDKDGALFIHSDVAIFYLPDVRRPGSLRQLSSLHDKYKGSPLFCKLGSVFSVILDNSENIDECESNGEWSRWTSAPDPVDGYPVLCEGLLSVVDHNRERVLVVDKEGAVWGLWMEPMQWERLREPHEGASPFALSLSFCNSLLIIHLKQDADGSYRSSTLLLSSAGDEEEEKGEEEKQTEAVVFAGGDPGVLNEQFAELQAELKKSREQNEKLSGQLLLLVKFLNESERRCHSLEEQLNRQP